MFKHLAGDSLAEQIAFAASQGFAAFEYPRLFQLRPRELGAYSKLVAEHDMIWGAACAFEEYGESAVDEDGSGSCRSRLHFELARSCDAAWVCREIKFAVVVPGRLAPGISRSEHLDQVSGTLCLNSREGVRYGWSYLVQPRQNLPGSSPMLLETVEDAVELCEWFESPAVKILYDVYEQTMNGRDVADDLRRYRQQIGYIRIGDAPGNKEPGTGNVPFERLFAQLREQQFDGVIGLDHGHARPGVAGEVAVLEGYRRLLA